MERAATGSFLNGDDDLRRDRFKFRSIWLTGKSNASVELCRLFCLAFHMAPFSVEPHSSASLLSARSQCPRLLITTQNGLVFTFPSNRDEHATKQHPKSLSHVVVRHMSALALRPVLLLLFASSRLAGDACCHSGSKFSDRFIEKIFRDQDLIQQ